MQDKTLKEILSILWDGKLTIISVTMLFIVIGITYSFIAQKWWSSNAEVGAPSVTDMLPLMYIVKRYEPIFDSLDEDGKLKLSNDLEKYSDHELTFQRFIQAFNSNINKKNFLIQSDEFKVVKDDIGNKDISNDEIDGWYTHINARSLDRAKNIRYNLSFQFIDAEGSQILLKNYINYINDIVRSELYAELYSQLQTKKSELTQRKLALELQAKSKLALEIEKGKYALKITSTANLEHPFVGGGNYNELFPVTMGSAALTTYINVLQGIKDLSLFENRLADINAKLSLAEKETTLVNGDLQVFHYLNEPQKPLSQTLPKRFFIILLCFNLGLVFGVLLVLIRKIVR
ncbi:Wzz/FepE/Etk N-terminal domain-containing protein [Vibrio cholerae]|uniref:Wzz/FepE/Etk N-terminal domain-containing protein n=1 Tax=Vibrio cholerae TaxID=666 RepID=UPI001E2E105C|nr:Wzz/FepE/Etk N-terminal domain-containing protein [Vibrio cholerae]MCD6724269.1 Wzz/FepE/Etk N-terminal domain-containing protein [Vibrio cholerae]